MAVTDKIAMPAGDINAQVADLRAQLNQLIDDKAIPMLNDARDGVVQKMDDLSGQVRSRPFTTIAITAAVAFLAGRLLR